MKKIPYNEKLNYYKSTLPHGYRIKVAEIAGVKIQSVSDFLYGRNKSIRIEDAILVALANLQKEKAKREELFKNAGIELV